MAGIGAQESRRLCRMLMAENAFSDTAHASRLDPCVADSRLLLAGGLCQGIAFPVNLGRFGNSFALFLGVQPAEIFLYVFLPPILFDAAVRIDYFVFKKVCCSLETAADVSYALSPCVLPIGACEHKEGSGA